LRKLLAYQAIKLATDLRCAANDVRCKHGCSSLYRRIAFQSITDKPALVLSPHPDDETFGCGGLIKLKRDAGVRVRVILLTDGEAVASAPGESREAVVSARRREFIEACHKLGLRKENLRWMHLPDGKVPHSGQPGFKSAMQSLLAEIKSFSPGEVYCTHIQDAHKDHVAAGHLARAALGQYSHPCTLFYYPIWMWHYTDSGLQHRLLGTGAWRLDIAATKDAKRQAMAVYLQAVKTIKGDPYCGRLPGYIMYNASRDYEVFFPSSGFV